MAGASFGHSIRGTGGEFHSDDGAGVIAGSEDKTGVLAVSKDGFGVHGMSKNNRGGVFESGPNTGQIRLVPMIQHTNDIALPKNAAIGDLLLIRQIVPSTNTLIGLDRCSLWLCVPGGSDFIGTNAHWQEIQLGAVIEGTI